MDRRAGFTLIELLLVLALGSILLAVAAPPVLVWRDALAVRAARDEIASALAHTRLAAVATGGAALTLEPGPGRVTVAVRDSVFVTRDLGREFGTSLDVGSAAPVVLRYDAFGIGRLTSRTIAVRKGRAEAGLTVSSYGRFRKW